MRERTGSAEWQSLAVIFSMGVFGMVAQALLFRLFLGILDGNELGIGCFFGAWLLWVAIGAAVAGQCNRASTTLTRRFEFLPLCYVPAFILQSWLISNARALTGIQGYEPFPLHTMVTVAFLGNAPVSFCTGFLFTLACRWLTTLRGVAVATVYTWECVGSLIGGGLTTILLDQGMSTESLFSWTALLMTITLAIHLIKQTAYVPALLPPLLLAGLMASNVVQHWENHTSLTVWRRILPVSSYGGSFITPDSKYFYGEYSGQFNVVAWGCVADTIPDTEHASEVVAVHLAQHPDARRFLVVGRGTLSICERLLTLPQADIVTWMDPDPAYPRLLLSRLPSAWAEDLSRLEIPSDDIRNWLRHTRAKYDVIILSLPKPTTLALNRYFTQDFYELLKTRLHTRGIVGVRVAAGENYMGRELVNVGASVLLTLRTTFTRLAIKPGEETWLIASDSQDLTNSPSVLRDRLASITDIGRFYPPNSLMSLYLPQRSAYQLDQYERAISGTASQLLLNTDRAPKSLLYGLLASEHESGTLIPAGDRIVAMALWGRPLAPFGLLLFLALRLVYVVRHRRPLTAIPAFAPPSRADSHALIVTSGAVGMGASILLMHMYQSAFGSLSIHVGLISAFYMLGLAMGSSISASLLSVPGITSNRLLAFTMLLHFLLLGGMALLGQYPIYIMFVLAIFISGVMGGIYVPLTAHRLNTSGVAPDAAGAIIQTLDHVGGAVGGMATGLLVLPLYGTDYALGVLALLLLTNIVAFLPPHLLPCHIPATDSRTRRYAAVGYAFFGLVVLVLAGPLLLRRGATDEIHEAFLSFSRHFAGGQSLQEQRAILANGKTLHYFRLPACISETTTNGPSYTFTTDTLAPDNAGYGGPIVMALMVAADGKLGGIDILSSRETPAYLDYLRPWLTRLLGKDLFSSDSLHDIDAVTGATITSAAVLNILRRSGPAFAGEVLGAPIRPAPLAVSHSQPYRPALWLTASVIVALFLRQRPSRTRRRIFLILTILVSGIVLNAQYSLAQILALIDLAIPPVGWNTAFVLVVCIPVLVCCFGNLYCGYLCPFGALQEIIEDLKSAAQRATPRRSTWGPLRFVKYAILGGLLLLFGLSHQHELAACDPLVTAFSRISSSFAKCLAIILVGLTLFIPRFWCRCLCPAGAFLSLFNRIRIFRRLSPTIVPPSCFYGVRHTAELDCLRCDRCRLPRNRERESLASPVVPPISAPNRILTMMIVAALAGIIGAQAILTCRHEEGHRPGMETGNRGARIVDMNKFQSGIRAGRLSTKEARFYRMSPEGLRVP